jgi:NAD(P)-dependent dehydrogenase (short-subunit alcohol dehydrogenase family)
MSTQDDGWTIVIAGGTGAIGKAVAREVLREGGHVTLLGRRSGEDPAVAKVIADLGPGAEYHACDVTDRRSVRDVVSECDPIRGAVFAAGVTYPSPAFEATDDEITETIQVNLYGLANFALETGAVMKDQRGGAFVSIGSWVEKVPDFDDVIYAASKAGGTAMTRGLALSLAPYGVRANVVSVGVVGGEGMAARHLGSHPEFAERLNVPLGSLASADEVASAVCYLLSDAAAQITGTTLDVDGGLSLRQDSTIHRV